MNLCRTIAHVALAAAALVVAAPAAALTCCFDLTGPTNSAQSSLPAAPTPGTSRSGYVTTSMPNGVLAGYNAPMTLRFYERDNAYTHGGFDISIDGGAANPMFRPGTFRLFSAGVGLAMTSFSAAAAAADRSAMIDDLNRDDFGRTYLRTISDQPPAAVPEPASAALMIGGFGLVGAMMRRRRPVAARA